METEEPDRQSDRRAARADLTYYIIMNITHDVRHWNWELTAKVLLCAVCLLAML